MKQVIQKQSNNLLNLMINNYCSNHEDKFTGLTLKIFKELYDHFISGDMFLQSIKISNSRTHMKIDTIKDIPKPNDFAYIIRSIRTVIHTTSRFKTVYTFNLFEKDIKIYLITDTLDLEKNDEYVRRILLWLFVITKYSTNKSCSKKLNIFIYLTSLLKFLPSVKTEKIEKYNVNTGFTTTCSKNSNIVIYRKEEWFKVFIHETFHNLGVDFSDANNNITKNFILKIFPIKSDVKLYEAYTDTWAKIINILLCSYLLSEKNFNDYINLTNNLLNLEKTYSVFQSVKILKFMGLTYNDLYSTNINSKYRRDKLYYEKTSVLSYYIINSIIMNNLQNFFKLCYENNINILQFDKTKESQLNLCNFIKKNYRTKSMLNAIYCITELISTLDENISKSEDVKYLLKNMRKSLFEIE